MTPEFEEVTLSKVREINKSPESYYNEVYSITNELDQHIKGVKELTNEEIISLVERLTCFTILFGFEIPVETPFLRAVEFDENQPKSFNSVSRLSYIPIGSEIEPKLGRMNVKKQSLFYATIGSNKKSYDTVLSEVRAKEGKKYIILESIVKDNGLIVIPIGVNDYFRRGVPHPFKLNKNFEEAYELIKKHIHPLGLMALNLCDAFLTNVLKKNEPFSKEDKPSSKKDELLLNKNTKRLYEVTSAISQECFKSGINGIIYPSTKFEGYPNIVLTPNAVDTKIIHKDAYLVMVRKGNKFGIYETELKNIGKIDQRLVIWVNDDDFVSLYETLEFQINNKTKFPNKNNTLFIQLVDCEEKSKDNFVLKKLGRNIGVTLDSYKSIDFIKTIVENNGVKWSHFFAEIRDEENSQITRDMFSEKISNEMSNGEIKVQFYNELGRRIPLSKI